MASASRHQYPGGSRVLQAKMLRGFGSVHAGGAIEGYLHTAAEAEGGNHTANHRARSHKILMIHPLPGRALLVPAPRYAL